MKDVLGHGSDTRGGAVSPAGYGVHGEHVLSKVGTPLQAAIAGFNAAAGKWASGITAAAAQQARDIAKLPKLKSAAEMNAEIEKIWSRK